MHQKRLSALLTAGALLCVSCPLTPAAAAESEKSDFLIHNGVLDEYTGNDPVVHVPEGVTEIGFYAFVRHKEVQLLEDPSVTLNIPYNDVLEEVYLPESLLVIDDYSFYNCVSLKKVHFQEGLIEIESHAFAGNMETNYAAYGLTGEETLMHLESVNLPDSLQTIGEYAFQNSGLEAVSFGKNLTEIGQNAFAYTNLKSVALPDSISALNRYAFAYSSLESVQIPDTVTQIPECTFLYSKLKSVTLPETIRTIGENAFKGTALTEITIPKAVESIGSYAFADTKIESVKFEDTVQNIGRDVFANTPYSQEKTITEGDFEILDNRLMQYHGNDITVTVPDSVEIIGESAFEGASRLMYVNIPDSVKQLGSRAFANCAQLREVHFGNNVETIGANVFMNCKKLRRMVLPDSVRQLDDRIFENCAQLRGVYFGNGTETIGNALFKNCVSLEDVRLNDGLTSVGSGIFDGCSGLKTLRLPDSLTVYPKEYYLHDTGTGKWEHIPDQVASFYMEHPEFFEGNVQELVECGLLSPEITDVVLYGEANSAAAQIAKERKLTFKPLSDIPQFGNSADGKDMTLNLNTDTWSFLNSGSVFGSSRYMTAEARVLAEQTVSGDLADLDEAFDGSCYGMSLTVILAKAGKLRASDMRTGAKTLGELEPDQIVQSVINFYHYMQFAQNLVSTSGITANDVLADMLETAENVPHGELPFLMSLTMESGNHAVVGYGLEKGEWSWNGRTYDRKILVWDPNNPNDLKDEACFYLNTKNFDYCLPLYNIIYENGENGQKTGSLSSCSNDLNRLLPVTYPFAIQVSAKRGDMNCDGQTDVSDAVLLARYLAEDKGAKVTDQGLKNAETDGNAGLTASDLTVMLQIIAKIVK